MARLISLGIITLLIVVLGVTFYQLIAPFLMPLFLAVVTAVLGQPLFRYFLRTRGNRRPMAAALSTFTILAAVMLPAAVATLLGVLELVTFTFHSQAEFFRAVDGAMQSQAAVEDDPAAATHIASENPLLTKTAQAATDLFERIFGRRVTWVETDVLRVIGFGDQESFNEDSGRLRQHREKWMAERLLQSRGVLQDVALRTVGVLGRTLGRTADLLAAVGALCIALVVYSIALYYFFADGPQLLVVSESLIPVNQTYQRELIAKLTTSVRAVVFATFGAAVAQGVATAIGIKLVSSGPFFLLLIVSTLAALVPMAGTWLVWFPYAAWLCWEDRWGAAMFLAVYGIGVVGMLDNVVRTYLLQSETKLHPLLAVVSVFGGIQVMGLWGVFIGPIVACCLHALLEIFNEEVRAISATTNEPTQPATPSTGNVPLDDRRAPAGDPESLPQRDETQLPSTATETLSQPKLPATQCSPPPTSLG